MPQPSSVSGVAGIVNTQAYQGPGIGEQLVQMAEAFSKVKMAQQEAAQKKLQVMLANVDKLPIDEKAIRKVAKQAGLPLADDDAISAIAKAGRSSASTTSSSKSPRPAQSVEGEGANPVATANEAAQKAQKNMTPKQAGQMTFDTWRAHAIALSNQEFQTKMAEAGAAEAKANKEKMIDQTYKLVIDPSVDQKTRTEAAGRLALTANVKLDMPTLSYLNGTPEQKQTLLGLYRGNMSEAERVKASGDMTSSLIASGMPAATAMKAANSWMQGQPISAELEKEMGTLTWDQLYKQSKIVEQLTQLGLTGEELKASTQAAIRTGNLFSALPPRFVPFAQKELDLKKQEVGIAASRAKSERMVAEADVAKAGVYKTQAETAAKREERLSRQADQKHQLNVAKLQVLELQGKHKEMLQAYHQMIEMKSKGIRPDQKMFDTLMKQLEAAGIDDPKSLTNVLSGQPAGAAPIPSGGNPVNEELGDK